MRIMTRYWNPWRDLEQLQNEVNRLFPQRQRPAHPAREEFPPINVWQAEHSLIITAEVPGLDADELDITVSTESVRIQGKQQQEPLKAGESYYRQERWTEPFTRTIDLPFEVDPQQTDATHENGVLTLTLHRPEEQKPRKVTVKAG